MRGSAWISIAVLSWALLCDGAGADDAGRLVLDNAYVRVTRNAAPCAAAAGCGERVLVALGTVELTTPRPMTLGRGKVAVFRKGEPYAPPAAGEFLEVAVKPAHPPVETPPLNIPPEKNALLFDGDDVRVFEEKLVSGDTRARHSHSQRVVVVINDTRLQQWPDGAPELMRQQVPDDVRFNPPVVHVVKNVGDQPLRNVVIELKGEPRTTPFKLGTFERQGRTLLGLVLEDQRVIDIAAASSALEKGHPGGRQLELPADMTQLIARYDGGWRERLRAIAAEADAAYVLDRETLRVRPPIAYPKTMLNAAVNYTEHASEMASAAPAAAAAAPSQSAPGLWERRPDDSRANPYLFPKLPGAVIADGEPIRVPPGRDKLDWECELALVVGRRASHVPLARAADYIFGYTLENDVSDRGGRGDTRFGSDWLVGKSHDTFAPLGPFVVPKEFIPDPQKLGIQFRLSGTLMQDSNTERMTHNVFELLHYASNILTLQPGDVISTGSPAGVGSARNPPIFMKPGDIAVCTIEGVGTLTNPVAAAEP